MLTWLGVHQNDAVCRTSKTFDTSVSRGEGADLDQQDSHVQMSEAASTVQRSLSLVSEVLKSMTFDGVPSLVFHWLRIVGTCPKRRLELEATT